MGSVDEVMIEKYDEEKANAKSEIVKRDCEGMDEDLKVENKNQSEVYIKEVKGQKEIEPKTPATERPQRQRKSVERLVSTFQKPSKFVVEKGHGAALKDIPNVKYKLSRKKWDDKVKLLHLALFARPGKAAQFKTNISRFSGIVWHDNEEKERIKLKERFDKCARDKLLGFCDVLDIQVVKSTTKKEDIVTKLIEFLEAPHATRDDLIADKESGKKRKRVGKKGSSVSGSSSSKGSAKNLKVTKKAFKNGDEKKICTSSEEESDEEELAHDETFNGTPERSDNEMTDQAECEEEVESVDESEEEKSKNKRDVKKSSTKKKSEGKTANKVVSQYSGQTESEKEVESEDESEEDMKKKRGPKKSSAKKDSAGRAAKKVVPRKSQQAESIDSGDESEEEEVKEESKKSSAKIEDAGKVTKKVVPQKSKLPKTPPKNAKGSTKTTGEIVNKPSTMNMSSEKETIGEKPSKGKENPEEEKLVPDDDELRDAISIILKEVDLHTANFTDILNQLVKRFDTDLIPRKSTIKHMIKEELTKLVDESEDDEDGGEDS